MAYFRENDVHHQTAVQLAKKHSDDKLVISFLILQELTSVLNRKASTEIAVQVAKMLLDSGGSISVLRLDENYIEDVIDLYKKLAPHSFSYVDVSLIHLSKELELPVLTFDKDLEKALAA